jgi:PRELI-like family
LTYSNLIELREKLTYSVDPEDDKRTLLLQEALIDVSAGFDMVKGYVEDTCGSKFKKNAETGRLGLEAVIKSIFPEKQTQTQNQ